LRTLGLNVAALLTLVADLLAVCGLTRTFAGIVAKLAAVVAHPICAPVCTVWAVTRHVAVATAIVAVY